MTRKCPFVGSLSFGCGFVYDRCALTLLLYLCPPFLSHLSANINFSVGNDSCRGPSACGYFDPVSIGDTSCNGSYACYNMYANVGDSSWYVYAIFLEIMFEFYLIRSCVLIDFPVHSSSQSNGVKACQESTAFIGDCFCNGDYVCYKNSVATAPDGCTASVSHMKFVIILNTSTQG